MLKKILIFVVAVITLVVIKYLVVNQMQVLKKNEVEKMIEEVEESKVPKEWQDNGIFSSYYEQAYEKLQNMSIEERIGQIFLVSYPNSNQIQILKEYHFGGYLFFEKDFKDKTESQVKTMIQELQKASNIPILTAVDEEGGTVVRVSSNSNLAKSKFQSPQNLYQKGGFEEIEKDTIEKSKLLSNLGINLNLAPVVDVSENNTDYMYARTLGKNEQLTAIYAKTVIASSKNTGVSYCLKHFPGYGNNTNTHTSTSVDERSYEQIYQKDLEPFRAGIAEGAESVLVSHNVVTSIDDKNAASLSLAIHELLRKELGFTGIIITDDLVMAAVSGDADATVKAVIAGNDLIITGDYKTSIQSIKQALEDKILTEDMINKLAFRVLAWKYYKGVIL